MVWSKEKEKVASIDFGTEMSLKTFLRVFTASSVAVNSAPQNQTDCVTFMKDRDKFPFDFLSELSPKRNQSVWENITRSITKFTNFCLLKNNVSGCTKPIINIAFPVISQNPTIPTQRATQTLQCT